MLPFYFHQDIMDKFRYLSISFRTSRTTKLMVRNHHKTSGQCRTMRDIIANNSHAGSILVCKRKLFPPENPSYVPQ